jgi:Cu(I)/Ag(I) efflux system membrane fusion protein
MKTHALHRLVRWLIGALVLVSVAMVGWWVGRQGVEPAAQTLADSTSAGAPQDPGQWSIAQGEAATRRHLRDGLKAGDQDPQTGRRILYYHDPMVPGRQFDAPAKSPFMDMMLVPRYAGSEGADSGSVNVSSRMQQNLGLRTVVVGEGRLKTEVLAVGNIAWSQREQTLLSARATGFVERLHVRAELDRVARGAPLLDLYVPDWVAVQEDYLAALRMQGPGAASLREGALVRMRQAGMSNEQIDSVVRAGQLQPRLTLRAPHAGFVSELLVREGVTVTPGMPLLRLQGTRQVWAEAEVPESQAAGLHAGMVVTATTPALPGETLKGELQALLPVLDAGTRTQRARLVLDNPRERLVAGQLAQLRFHSEEGETRLLLPSDALIRTGQRNVVMLAEADGHFRPVEVELGRESDGQVELLAGLQVGQRVVVSGQFLVDSEASLRGLQARLNQEAQPAQTVGASHRTAARIAGFKDGLITLDHPPIASLQWPAMVMDFRLPPPDRLPRNLVTGERVQVEFREQDGELPLILDLRRAAPGAPR